MLLGTSDEVHYVPTRSLNLDGPLSNNQLRENFDSVRFFHEGVATYIERRFFSDPSLAAQRLAAAVLMRREDANFDRLVDNDRLRQEHEPMLVYELGEVFAAAIVRKFGDESIGKLARTFANKQHSEGLNGVALWRSVFQASGYSLNEAVDEHYQLLGEAAELHAETTELLVELHPVVEQEGDTIRLSVDVTPPDGWKVVVRFRASRSAADDECWQQTLKNGFVVTLANRFVSRTAWYLVGYQKDEKSPIFQSWQSVRF
ncbi:hypothetical protein [Novipirellula artificiosorum]|uniref:Uncharacterized protein n=1 Tax=Novipirellula artificiosorum TaxID=2528016 RepID=A0A5C6DYD9_9BACT|nr:hypothetical protein [Novipirellula artificiosorum]TWU40421.1 hypothetical protein Poly41_12530 [Novipirellula artificiosorum]